MAKSVHRGSELNNVTETWRENEAQRSGDAGSASEMGDATTVSDDLQQTISEEAAEYDNDNSEDQLLGGDRASVNDEQ